MTAPLIRLDRQRDLGPSVLRRLRWNPHVLGAAAYPMEAHPADLDVAPRPLAFTSMCGTMVSMATTGRTCSTSRRWATGVTSRSGLWSSASRAALGSRTRRDSN